MTFAIIKNAELPASNRKGAKAIYPFAQMEVGDGFDAPRDKGKDKFGHDRRQTSIRGSVNTYAKRNNHSAKFVVRLVDENTVRCVRVA